MKQSMTLNELRGEVARQAATKQDFVIPQNAMAYTATGETLTFAGRSFPMTDLCHRQLAGALKFPHPFYQRMRKNHPDLHEADVNRLIKETDKGRMVRTLDGNARAIVGKRFLRVDADQLMDIVLPELEGLGLVVESAHVDGERLFVKAFTAKLEGELAPGEAVRGGFLFSTSEVGLGKIWVASMVEVLRNNVGAILGSTLGSYERRHAGPEVSVDEDTGLALNEVVPSFAAMAVKIRESIHAALSEDTFRQLLAKMRFTGTLSIPSGLDLEILMVRLKRKLNLTDGECSRVLGHLAFEEKTLLGLMQAVCRASHDCMTYNRATEMEILGGSLLDLSHREWMNLTEIPAPAATAVTPAA